MRAYGLALLAALTACSEAPVASALTNEATKSETTQPSAITQTEAGPYQIDVDSKIDLKSMPTNADLKMLDGDLARYAVKLCGLDFANKLAPTRCEVFVQADKSGLLVGYIALQQGKKTSIETALETDRQRGGTGCFLSGTLENSDYENIESKLEVSGNFEARLPFFGWEKSPGDWMISPESDDQYSAGGMWYVKRLNGKLRISQERWNYCYSDSAVNLDEVFTHAVSLTRLIHRAPGSVLANVA